MVCCNGISGLCGCYVRLNAHTNHIFHCKTLWNIVLCGFWVWLNTHTNRIFHRKTPKNSVLQWNIVFVWLLNPTQYPHKSYIPLQNAKKSVFCYGISCLCGCWVRLNTHINCIFPCKTLKNCVSQWNIVFLWLLSPTQYPHKSYIPLQIAKKSVFCNVISCLCGCWVRLNNHTNRTFHCKTLQKLVFCNGISCVCVWLLSQTQYPHKSYITLQSAKKMCFAMECRVCVAGESD